VRLALVASITDVLDLKESSSKCPLARGRA
jgi:hypothetical protein